MEKDAARRYQSAGEMMQQCQQVFAELNQGGVSVGGGGVPRTMIASNPQQLMGMPAHGGMPPQQMPMGGPPQQMGGLAPPHGGYPPAGSQAKTMIAQQSPFQGGMPGQPGMPPQGMPPHGMPPQGMQPMPMGGPGVPMPGQAPPPPGGFVQASPMQKTIVAGMAPAIMGGQMMPQGTPQGGFPPQQQQPNKTVMIQPTEGVVSVAARSGLSAGVQALQQQGASTTFWIVCLVTGILVGVLGYVIVAAI